MRDPRKTGAPLGWRAGATSLALCREHRAGFHGTRNHVKAWGVSVMLFVGITQTANKLMISWEKYIRYILMSPTTYSIPIWTWNDHLQSIRN